MDLTFLERRSGSRSGLDLSGSPGRYVTADDTIGRSSKLMVLLTAQRSCCGAATALLPFRDLILNSAKMLPLLSLAPRHCQTIRGLLEGFYAHSLLRARTEKMSRKRDAEGFEVPDETFTHTCEYFDDHADAGSIVCCTTDDSSFSGKSSSSSPRLTL